MVATGWLREFRSTITSLVGGSSKVKRASGLLATLNSMPSCLAVSATFSWKNRSSIKAATRPMQISPCVLRRLQQPSRGPSPAAFEVLQSACPPRDLDASSFTSLFFVAAARLFAGEDPGDPGDASARRSSGYPRLEARCGSLVYFGGPGTPAADRAVVWGSRQANRCGQQSHFGQVRGTRPVPTPENARAPIPGRFCRVAPGSFFLLAWNPFRCRLAHWGSSRDGS